jgi:hypothetical protein
MAALDLIAAMEKYQASLGTRTIEVPEWGTTFFVTPLTLKEQSVLHGWKERSREEQLLVYARIIAMKAQDDKGARLFADKDYALLVEKDYQLLSRLGAEIVTAPEVEEIKN